MKRVLTDKEFIKEYDENRKLIYWVLRHNLHLDEKWFYDYFSFEDVVSVGKEGRLKGINGYEPDKGTKKNAFYCSCIKNEIIQTCIVNENRKRRKGNHETISLNSKIENETDDILELIDVCCKEEDCDLSMRLFYYKEMLHELIESNFFTKIELDVLYKSFQGYTLSAIAKLNRCSRQNISNTYHRILKKLRPYSVCTDVN